MKKDISLSFTKIIYILFLIGTIITIFIVYKNIENEVATGFLIAYAIIVFFFLFYITFITILNLRKLKWVEIRGRIFKFIICFAIFGASNYILDYVFRPSKIDLFREFFISFGVAFGIAFIDVILSKKEGKLK